MAGSLRVFAKPTACLHPSGVMKGSIISTPSLGSRERGAERQEKEEEEEEEDEGAGGGRQSAPLYGQRSGAGVLLQ